MTESNNVLAKIILPGILPLLGGTANLSMALTISLSSIFLAYILRLVFVSIEKNIPGDIRDLLWVLLIAIGLALSYSLYLLLPVIFPFTADFINKYLLFLGLTPVVYCGCKRQISWKKLTSSLLAFSSLMLLNGILREFLGEGMILGQQFLDTAPLVIISGPAGAFFILGGLWFVFDIILGKSFDISPDNEINKERGQTIE